MRAVVAEARLRRHLSSLDTAVATRSPDGSAPRSFACFVRQPDTGKCQARSSCDRRACLPATASLSAAAAASCLAKLVRTACARPCALGSSCCDDNEATGVCRKPHKQVKLNRTERDEPRRDMTPRAARARPAYGCPSPSGCSRTNCDIHNTSVLPNLSLTRSAIPRRAALAAPRSPHRAPDSPSLHSPWPFHLAAISSSHHRATHPSSLPPFVRRARCTMVGCAT